MNDRRSLVDIRALIKACGREASSGSTEAEELSLDPVKALQHIKTLARAAQDSDDAALLRKHMEMILVLVDKALPSGPENPSEAFFGV